MNMSIKKTIAQSIVCTMISFAAALVAVLFLGLSQETVAPIEVWFAASAKAAFIVGTLSGIMLFAAEYER